MSKRDQALTRRRFLQGAGAAALSALLSACGLTEDPTTPAPTTPASQTPRIPTMTPSPTGTASPSATGATHETYLSGVFNSPMESPLDSPLVPTGTEAPPTATRPPTPTPTPPPTPFPAGPPTKLGLFVAWYHPQVMELIATKNVAILKTLELDPAFLAEVKSVSPDTIIVGRVTMGQVDLNRADPKAEARRAVDAVRPLSLDGRRAGLVDAWEGFNEPVPGSEDEMLRLAELEAERVRLLAQDGQRALIGNFGAGQPPLEWWPAFRPALEVGQDHGSYLGLHEYSAPTIWYHTSRQPLDFGASPSDSGWLTLRYRKVYDQYLRPWGLELPLLVTECGVDGLVTDRPGPVGRGWQDFAAYWAELGMGWDTAGNYIEQLAWYDSQIQLDAYVKGAAIFAMTAFDGWGSYQLQGPAATILQQYLSVHPLR
jgi:hypothetical protein